MRVVIVSGSRDALTVLQTGKVERELDLTQAHLVIHGACGADYARELGVV